MSETLIIIPARNEEASLERVIQGVRSQGFAVLVVDDASEDGSAALARRCGAITLCLPFHSGGAAALQCGYMYALEHGYAYAAQIDGDGQHECADLPRLLAPVREGRADMALGSRFLGVGQYRMPFARLWGKRLFTLLVRLCARQRVSDPTSGFRAMNRRMLELYASDEFTDEYPDADMLILALRRGLRVTEVGVRMYPRQSGKGMHCGILQPCYYTLRMLLAVFVEYLRPLPGSQPSQHKD